VSVAVRGDLLDSLLESLNSDLLELGEVALLEPGDVVEHGDCSVVEVLLKVDSLIDEVVHQRSLLDVLVLLMDSHVLNLLLGLSEVLVAFEFCGVLPLVEKLVGLVVREDIVENSEFGSRDEGEVTNLSVSNNEGDEELLMEHESGEPLVVMNTSKSRDHLDCSEVGEHEDEASSGLGERLIVRRDLLRTHS
jgi:hypothetical protein